MKKELLKSVDVFVSLSDELLEKVADIATIKHLKKDNMLFYEGDKPNYIYALLSGQLKLYKMGIKDNEIVLHHFTKPCLVAEMTAFEQINFPASAIVMKDDTVVALIKIDEFLNLINENSSFSIGFIRSLTKKIKNLEQTINRNLVFDATLKVCSLLEDNPAIFQALKNKEIAQLLNMAPETISRVLKKLKKIGILDEKNRLLDKDKLSLLDEWKNS
ncbi:Crp/Fnr family transcriptional regulator [Sulfurimonas sp.]|uniref:Crp/Fnr family transcriptional regulator n=1 Tax=Sulfurimonas sp. TaxID=2022749 RepID=UPI00356A2F7C